MVLRRLTKIQKNQILDGYRNGETAIDLAMKFSCSSNTINRTVKNMVSGDEYILLKEKRSKINKNKYVTLTSEEIKHENENSGFPLPKVENHVFNESSKEENIFEEDLDLAKNNKREIHDENKLEEIPPIESILDFDMEQKKLDLMVLDNEILPEIVYILVDKKVELEAQQISNLPEWGFLPEDELERNAILLFHNQRSAKRSCSRNQRVIKIPNTKVFETAKSYLLAKGITRLILEDSLISLIN